MTHIQAEGTEFEYVAANDARDAFRAIGLDVHGGNIALATGPDTRLALFRSLLPPHALTCYWLIWQGEVDLRDVDRRVQLGTANIEDFLLALRTVKHLTRCFKCGASYRTLVIDAGDPYPLAPDLHRAKIARLQALPCPKCGGSLRQLVAKIIAEEVCPTAPSCRP